MGANLDRRGERARRVGPLGGARSVAALALLLGACAGSDDGPDGAAPDDAAAPPGAATGPTPTDDASGAGAFFRPDQVRVESAAGTVEIVDGYDDARGLIAVQERFLDGVPFETRRYAYDAGGRLTERVDLRGEGAEVVGTVAFAYANGALAALEFADADGLATRRTVYEFDADGLVVSSNFTALVDEAGAPLPDGGLLIERVDYAYAGGRLVAEAVDENGDGTVDRTRDYAWLPDGRLERVTESDLAGGTVAEETWRYELGPSCSLAWANSLFAHFCVPADALSR